VYTRNLLPSVFGKGKEHIEVLAAVIANKIVGRHLFILTELFIPVQIKNLRAHKNYPKSQSIGQGRIHTISRHRRQG
jgi:hypothetical protein